MTWSFGFEAPPEGSAKELRALLGGKGANLAVMTAELGLPVPPGFVISTAACKAWMEGGWPEGLDDELRTQMAIIEDQAGRRFGSAKDPLLVSVRSGAPVSMPGMLDTILNLGLNDETTAALAETSGDAEFAAACRARLGTMYRDIVGVEEVPADPWQQLRGAVEAVFRSWDSDRAQSYREKESIPADLGTAVVVQAMVFGNRGPDSGTGVLFTRNPATGENVPYGDILFGAQGEDVVAGTHATEPISALDARLPAVADELSDYSTRLELHNRDVCDIEFTIESGRLWMLQNRVGKRTAQAACRVALEMAQDPDFPLTREEAVDRVRGILADPPVVPSEREGAGEPLAVGLAASPGLACGVIATSPDAAVSMNEAGEDVLLVRAETSPDDVHGMAKSVGILTTTGGLASHAAVVARGWDIPAVVGASDVAVSDGAVRIAGRSFREGEMLSIDGTTGEVFEGRVVSSTSVIPEAAILLAWAAEIGMEIAEAEDAVAVEPAGAADTGDSSTDRDAAVRALAIRGYATVDMLAPALGASTDDTTIKLTALVDEDLAKESGGMFSLTEEGKTVGAELIAIDGGIWGAEAAAAALDAFLVLDGRMKTIVTAWQMKEVDGEQVINDHADAEYDAAVLADLAALAEEADAWLVAAVQGLARLVSYQTRLAAAAEKVAAGDGMFMASPRVDSYHGAWFELHEDLIRLAGKTREEEVAAGRA